jgi:hypothetical protein
LPGLLGLLYRHKVSKIFKSRFGNRPEVPPSGRTSGIERQDEKKSFIFIDCILQYRNDRLREEAYQ